MDRMIEITVNVNLRCDDTLSQQDAEALAHEQLIRGLNSVCNPDRDDAGLVSAVTSYFKTVKAY